jgi:hypothetical protein
MQEEDFRTSALLRLGVSRREPVRGRQSSGRRGGRGRGRSAIAPYDDRYGQSVIKIISTGQPVVRGRGSRRRRRGRGQGGTPSNLLYTQNGNDKKYNASFPFKFSVA